MKTIWYKHYSGEWRKSSLKATEKNFRKVKKEMALNGQVGIFEN